MARGQPCLGLHATPILKVGRHCSPQKNSIRQRHKDTAGRSLGVCACGQRQPIGRPSESRCGQSCLKPASNSSAGCLPLELYPPPPPKILFLFIGQVGSGGRGRPQELFHGQAHLQSAGSLPRGMGQVAETKTCSSIWVSLADDGGSSPRPFLCCLPRSTGRAGRRVGSARQSARHPEPRHGGQQRANSPPLRSLLSKQITFTHSSYTGKVHAIILPGGLAPRSPTPWGTLVGWPWRSASPVGLRTPRPGLEPARHGARADSDFP